MSLVSFRRIYKWITWKLVGIPSIYYYFPWLPNSHEKWKAKECNEPTEFKSKNPNYGSSSICQNIQTLTIKSNMWMGILWHSFRIIVNVSFFAIFHFTIKYFNYDGNMTKGVHVYKNSNEKLHVTAITSHLMYERICVFVFQ